MAVNKYFNLYHQKKEQNLVQDLIEESIKIHGINAIYIPRTNVNVDKLFREDVLAKFDDYYDIEVYIKNIDGFDGDQDIFKKFGLEIKNQVTFTISRSSFAKIVAGELSRPREGDLVYIPLSNADALYEIRFVKDDSVFYNLGEFYTFDLQCEQYAFQDEEVHTGLEQIDDIGTEGSQVFSLRLKENSGSGSFIKDEMIYQGDSPISPTAKAIFVSTISSDTIKIKNLYQTFDPENGPVKGVDSKAQYELYNPVNRADNILNITDDFGAQNKEIVYIDFTESNPFSEDE